MLIGALGLQPPNGPEMLSVQGVDLAVQAVSCRCHKTIEEADSPGKMVGPIPIQGLNGIAALDLDDVYTRKTSQGRSLLTQVPTTGKKLKH